MSAATTKKNRRSRPVTTEQREQRDRERRGQLEALHGELLEQLEALTGSRTGKSKTQVIVGAIEEQQHKDGSQARWSRRPPGKG